MGRTTGSTPGIPQYIRTTLPTLRMFSDVYHRAEVRGLDNIPAEGPVLLVGNHSGGTLISDTFVFAQAFYDHFGPLRRFHQLAHDLVFQLPGVRGVAVALRDRAGVAGEHGPRAGARRRAARLSRRRPRDLPPDAGSPRRSTSPAAPAS